MVLLNSQDAVVLSVVIGMFGTTTLLMGTVNVYLSVGVFTSSKVNEALTNFGAKGFSVEEMR